MAAAISWSFPVIAEISGGFFEPGSPLSDEKGFRLDVLEAYIELVIESLEESGKRDQLKIAFDEWNLRAWQHPGFPRGHVDNYEDPEILALVERRIKGNDLNSRYAMADALFAASFFNACPLTRLSLST